MRCAASPLPGLSQVEGPLELLLRQLASLTPLGFLFPAWYRANGLFPNQAAEGNQNSLDRLGKAQATAPGPSRQRPAVRGF